MSALPMDMELVARRFLEAEEELTQLTATLRSLRSEAERAEEMRKSAGVAIARLEEAASAAQGVFARLLPIVESLRALASERALASIATFPDFLERTSATVLRSTAEMDDSIARRMAPLRVLAWLNFMLLIGIGVLVAVRA